MINAIVAIEKNQGIGFEGTLPWPYLKEDMNWFKEKTKNQIVIMGRKTWESIGRKKLSNRINIVISSRFIETADRCFSNLDRTLNFCETFYPSKEIFVIGGSAIYQEFLERIQRFYITEIDANYTCDTFFNLNYVKENFSNIKEHIRIDNPIKYVIKEYNR